MPLAEMVARSSELKRELVAYARQPRFDKAFDQMFSEVGADPLDEAAFVTILDAFILQHRLRDGRTVLERFLDTRRDLAESDRTLLAGWRDVVEGLFEVKQREDDALVLFNVIDELTYRTHSNTGTAIFAQMPCRSFLFARLVPIGDEWLFSGYQKMFPASARRDVARMAAELSLTRPALVFRNPAKLKLGWELQDKDRATFVEFFGTDLVIETGEEIVDHLRDYGDFRDRRLVKGAANGERSVPYPIPPPDLTDAPTVGLIYDQTEGLTYLGNLGLFAEAFDEPERVARPSHRTIVRDYLRDDSISPLPFRRFADSDPAKASRVFQLLLKRPRFAWESDGETLLRRHKAAFFDSPPLPRFTPADGIVLEHYRASRPQRPRP